MTNRIDRVADEIGGTARALFQGVVLSTIGVWGACFLMMPVVFYTTAFVVYGSDFLNYDLPLPMAMRRTMLVFAPATVMAISSLALLGELLIAYAGRGIPPSQNSLTVTRHIRRGGTFAVIFAAWCYFPVAYRFGPNIAIVSAILAAGGGIVFYRMFDIPRVAATAWRRYRRGAPPLSATQQLNATDEMYLDAYLDKKSIRPTVAPGNLKLTEHD